MHLQRREGGGIWRVVLRVPVQPPAEVNTSHEQSVTAGLDVRSGALDGSAVYLRPSNFTFTPLL